MIKILTVLEFIALALFSACVACGCTIPTGADVPEVVNEEWAIGQSQLAPVYGQRVYDVWPSMFNWEQMPNIFMCGDVRAVGCFSPLHRKIQWFDAHAIRHEAGHAILWKLGEDWRDYEH